jgi:transposase
MAIPRRPMTAEAVDTLHRLAQSRPEPARVVARARMIWLAHHGQQGPALGRELRRCPATVRCWRQRCNGRGLAGVQAAPRPGRPVSSTSEPGSEVIATRLTKPQELGLPFASWTLDRLATYLQEVKGIPIKRSRIDELLLREGLRWRTQETWFGERVDPAFAVKRGASRRSIPRRRRAVS